MNSKTLRREYLSLLEGSGVYTEACEAIAMTLADFGEPLCELMRENMDEVFTDVDGTEIILHSNHERFGNVVEMHSVYFKEGYAFIQFIEFSQLVDSLLSGNRSKRINLVDASAEDRSDFEESSVEYGW